MIHEAQLTTQSLSLAEPEYVSRRTLDGHSKDPCMMAMPSKVRAPVAVNLALTVASEPALVLGHDAT
jgi:hypothetical protein